MESKKTDITQILKYILYVIALLGGLLHIYNSAFGTISSFQMRPLHLAIVGVIAVLMELTKLKDKKHPVVTSVMNMVIMLFVLFGVS